jgi:hypothetical protein
MFLKCAERQARPAAITLTQTRRQGRFESGAKAHQIALQLSMDTQFYELIPTRIDHDPCARWRMPMDMMRHGWLTRLFQAKQQWSTMSS